MAFTDTGLTLAQAKLRPEFAQLKQIDPGGTTNGVYQAGNTYYGMGPSGTVQSSTDLSDFGIGQPATKSTAPPGWKNGPLDPGFTGPGGGPTPTQNKPNVDVGSGGPLLAPSAGPNPVAAPAPAATGPAPSYGDTSATARQILTDQMKGLSGEPTTAQSPEIAPAIAAYNTQSQRDQQAERDQLAEREYATNEGAGLKSGGFNTNVQAGAERAALGRANFTGSAVMQVAQQKRQQLTDMLKTAVSSGLTDKAQQIQAMIAQIDAHLRQQGITNQLAEYGTDAGLRQQGITNQNTQANNYLGYSYANLIAQQNREALLAGLNG